MSLEFLVQRQASSFESPFKNFETVTLEGEIRTDPITGHVCRVVPFRLKRFEARDLTELIERSRKICPFCPECVFDKTTRFTSDFGAPGGRIKSGSAIMFPNAFPYAEYSAVVVLGPEHFVDPASFTPGMFVDGFNASNVYLQLVLDRSPDVTFASVNANYMPLSGAGLIHPHLQVLATDKPTRYHEKLIRAADARDGNRPSALFLELLETEEHAGERYVGRTGAVHWLSAFAPTGMYDVWGLYPEGPSFIEMDQSVYHDFADGLCRVLRFFGSKYIQSYNLALYTCSKTERTPTFHLARVVPRVNLPGFDVSDINYFERLHDESLTFFTPEEAAKEMRGFF
ncbi:MAG: hypothetical protein HY788_23150 [Deltaproteobacteria bacterium]|nr:hypothetical protein [Deltaproteobacteria bacterium]